MHARLRDKVASYGFTEAEGNFLILPYVAEDIDKICESLHSWSTLNPKISAQKEGTRSDQPGMVVDTLVSILTICSLTSPTETLRNLVQRTLRPNGQLLFYEHVRNPRPTVAQVQDAVAPFWKRFFDGCVVGLDGVRAVWDAGFLESSSGVKAEDGTNMWADMKNWDLEGEDKDNVFWHQIGRCVKSSDGSL